MANDKRVTGIEITYENGTKTTTTKYSESDDPEEISSTETTVEENSKIKRKKK